MPTPEPALDIILPVHNEGESIEATLREIYRHASAIAPTRLIVCEDGSVDHTREVLARLNDDLPMKLLTGAERKGYSRAMIDGMSAVEAPYVLGLDSDGQCDPADIGRFWRVREEADIIRGWRTDRQDRFIRKAASRSFYRLYRLFFRVPVRDPGFAFVLTRRSVVNAMHRELGVMEHGFWWEFVARAYRRGFTFKDVPVNHRPRPSGETQIYKLSSIPRIGYRHALALFKIRFQTRATRQPIHPADSEISESRSRKPPAS
jgi:dolichol-phosphate mannosyltransferase